MICSRGVCSRDWAARLGEGLRVVAQTPLDTPGIESIHLHTGPTSELELDRSATALAEDRFTEY
jgi:hypothetical protein